MRYHLEKKNYLNLIKQYGGVIDVSSGGFTGNNKEELKKFIVDFIAKCTHISTVDNEYTSYHWAIIEIKGKQYPCIIEVKKTEESHDPYKIFSLYFINTNCDDEYLKIQGNVENIVDNIYEYNFLHITFSSQDSVTTHISFEPFEGKTKLQTALEILEIIYKYFGKKEVVLIDISQFKCPSPVEQKENKCKSYIESEDIIYSSLVYRILATDYPIERISIYTSHGYKYKCNKTNLEIVRNMPIKKFITLLDIYINSVTPNLEKQRTEYKKTPQTNKSQLGHLQNIIITEKLQNSIKKMIEMIKIKIGDDDQKIHTFFKNIKMNDITSCRSNVLFFETMTNLINNFTKINNLLQKTDQFDSYFVEIQELKSYFDNFSYLLGCMTNLKKEL